MSTDAIKKMDFPDLIAQETSIPTVLLGNGFSIARFRNIFSYKKLFESVKPEMSSALASLFDGLGSCDFERVLGMLENGSTLMHYYYKNEEYSLHLSKEVTALREKLIKAISDGHPHDRFALQQEDYTSCGKFLKKFNGIFTTNYDLLLYWVLNESNEKYANNGYKYQDCFYEKDDAGNLFWVPTKNSQNVHYLHGAVHILRHGNRHHKITYTKNSETLMNQLKEQMKEGIMPLFVCESSHDKKLEQIRDDAYLSHAFSCLRKIHGSLYIHGSKLDRVDKHLWDIIEDANLSRLCVSFHDMGDSNEEKEVVSNAKEIVNRYLIHGRQLDLYFYPASSARIWPETGTMDLPFKRAAW